METGIGHGCEWLHVTLDDMLFVPSANSVQVTSLCVRVPERPSSPRIRSSGSLCSGEHGLLRVPVSPWIRHAAPEWQGDELRAGAPSCSYNSHVDALRVWVVVRVVSHAVSPPDVDLVLLTLAGGLAVDGVVEVHALGGVAPPVAPHQVDSGAHQAEHHCGNDRNCMRLTHSGRDMGRGGALTRHKSMA